MKMDITTLFLLILIGLAAGILGGMVGLGGGIILIPALILIMKLNQQTAQGTSIVIALAFMVGGYFGSSWALKLSPDLMRKIFSVILVVIAIKMFFSSKSG